MRNLSRWFPFLNWPAPSAALLRGEFAAGLTVALVMVPQSVAYAGLAGMPLVTGLYAALLPPSGGGAVRQFHAAVGRPAALTCVLVGASLTGLAGPRAPSGWRWPSGWRCCPA
jgi:SulP family sulfate permease